MFGISRSLQNVFEIFEFGKVVIKKVASAELLTEL